MRSALRVHWEQNWGVTRMKAILIFMIVTFLAWVGLSLLIHSLMSEFQKDFNECRDKGGSVSFCATGLK